MSILTPAQIAEVNSKVKDEITPENFDKKLAINVGGMIDALVTHLGQDLDAKGNSRNTCTMTDATEYYWGTSGRGNANAKGKILAASRLGYITIEQKGRTMRVGISEKGYEILGQYQKLQAADWATNEKLPLVR